MTPLEKLRFEVDDISYQLKRCKAKLTTVKGKILTNFTLQDIVKLTNEKVTKLEMIIIEQEKQLKLGVEWARRQNKLEE